MLPCLNDRCYSPVACNGFGYCREQNMTRLAPARVQSIAMTPERIRRAAQVLREDAAVFKEHGVPPYFGPDDLSQHEYDEMLTLADELDRLAARCLP